MRKRLKKFLSLALALTLCASLCVPALAADTTVTVTQQSNFGEVKTAKDEYGFDYQWIEVAGGKTYQLDTDVVLSTDDYDVTLKITDGQPITLDLNGHTLSGEATEDGDNENINIHGSVTLMDSKGGGKVASGLSCYGEALTVESGEYSHLYAGDSQEDTETQNNTVVINGGTFEMVNGLAGNWKITGGSFRDGVYAYAKNLEISGGVFENWVYPCGSDGADTKPVTGDEVVTISGGTFKDFVFF